MFHFKLFMHFIFITALPCITLLHIFDMFCLHVVLFVQGIDLKAGDKSKKMARTAPKSNDIYLKLLVKVSSLAIYKLFSGFWCGRSIL